NDYRSIDIGIACASIAYAATEVGLSTCILGWFDDNKIRSLLNLDKPVRLVITLGYADDNDKLREKKRKDMNALVNFIE
ncbi:MAG: nitroreductase family protein, partial [Clostridia bacterium]|nr:nitroreductase family protein [Clostridia bacterium]